MFSRQPRALFLLLIASICALSAYSYLITEKTYHINQQLGREKLKYEALLAEKLSIEKSLVKVRKKLAALEDTESNSNQK